jgi:hypothetical protein
MLAYLKKDGGEFEPEEISMLVGAFDLAWQSVVKSGAHLDDQTEFVRETLARRIIETAKRGERNQRSLCDSALMHLTEMSLQKMRAADGR